MVFWESVLGVFGCLSVFFGSKSLEAVWWSVLDGFCVGLLVFWGKQFCCSVVVWGEKSWFLRRFPACLLCLLDGNLAIDWSCVLPGWWSVFSLFPKKKFLMFQSYLQLGLSCLTRRFVWSIPIMVHVLSCFYWLNLLKWSPTWGGWRWPMPMRLVFWKVMAMVERPFVNVIAVIELKDTEKVFRRYKPG